MAYSDCMIPEYEGWGIWIQNMGCTFELSDSYNEMDVHIDNKITAITKSAAARYLVEKLYKQLELKEWEIKQIYEQLFLTGEYKIVDTSRMRVIPKTQHCILL